MVLLTKNVLNNNIIETSVGSNNKVTVKIKLSKFKDS